MILVDGAPLCAPRPRGVALALHTLLQGLAEVERDPSVCVALPGPITVAAPVPSLDGVVTSDPPVASMPAWRRRLTGLCAARDARALLVPWTAMPRRGPPTVVWMHECPDARWGAIEGRIRLWRQRRHRRRVARRAAAVVVPSEATASDVRTLLPALASRVHVIPNGFDPRPWTARPSARPPYAVIVGTGARAAGARKKGMDRVPALRAALAPDLAVRVIGDGQAAPEDVRRVVAEARVLLHPARSEGFGYAPLEAMACGVPAVVGDGGALPEVAGPGAVVVPEGDVDAMARAARDLAREGELREDAQARGAARAQAFPPREIAVRWLALLRRVAEAA